MLAKECELLHDIRKFVESSFLPKQEAQSRKNGGWLKQRLKVGPDSDVDNVKDHISKSCALCGIEITQDENNPAFVEVLVTEDTLGNYAYFCPDVRLPGKKRSCKGRANVSVAPQTQKRQRCQAAAQRKVERPMQQPRARCKDVETADITPPKSTRLTLGGVSAHREAERQETIAKTPKHQQAADDPKPLPPNTTSMSVAETPHQAAPFLEAHAQTSASVAQTPHQAAREAATQNTSAIVVSDSPGPSSPRKPSFKSVLLNNIDSFCTANQDSRLLAKSSPDSRSSCAPSTKPSSSKSLLERDRHGGIDKENKSTFAGTSAMKAIQVTHKMQKRTTVKARHKEYLDAKIVFSEDNPRLVGSDGHRRYEMYRRSTTRREAYFHGATALDLKRDEKAGLLKRQPIRRHEKKAGWCKGKVMPGIYRDNAQGNIIAERFCCYLGIQARLQRSNEQAEASLKAIDRVNAFMKGQINDRIMAGKTASLNEFMAWIKAAIAAEGKASPSLAVDKWRFYSKAPVKSFTPASLKKLCKDPRISRAEVELRVLQGTLKEVLPSWLKLLKALGKNDVGDIVGIDGIDSGRRAADDLARKVMASLPQGAHPSDEAVLQALRLWGFERNVSRQNVIPGGHDWVHSDTLGILETRCGHNLQVSRPTKGHENFVRLLSSWARKRSPSGTLPFTTISLNKNYGGKLHRDAGNIGPSIGLAIGPFKGGKLRYWPSDSNRGQRSAHVEEVRHEPSISLDIRQGAVFDGNCAHEVQDFTGERYSLIFFTVKKYKQTTDEEKRKMIQMGADWPSGAALERLHQKVPRI